MTIPLFGDLILRDATENKPSPGKVGRLFYDTSLNKLERDNGIAWEDCEPSPAGGGYTQGARAYKNSNVSIANNSWAELSFNVEDYDTDAIHDNSLNPGRMTCKTAGRYLVIGSVAWLANVAGTRQAQIMLNNTTVLTWQCINAVNSVDFGTTQQIVTIVQMSVSDYVTLDVYQNSGGALWLPFAENSLCSFGMQRIG